MKTSLFQIVPGSLSAVAYASFFWVFCIGDYFVGPLLFSVFFLALAIVIFALRLHSARL
jgi:hypothetical protein